jgi:DNA-binding transcriptional ArsR family regulator
MYWRIIWGWLKTWQGIVPSVIAVAAATYYGPKKMLEVWDWYVDRFRDRDVLLVLKDKKMINYTTAHGSGQVTTGTTEGPYSVSDIAAQINRSERSVSRSLKRLYAHDKIEKYEWGWRLKNSK